MGFVKDCLRFQPVEIPAPPMQTLIDFFNNWNIL